MTSKPTKWKFKNTQNINLQAVKANIIQYVI